MATLLSSLLDFTRLDSDDGVSTFGTTIDPAFTIGPKVHGGTLQMVSARAAALALADAVPDVGDIHPLAVTSNYLSAPDPAGITLVTRVRKTGRTVSIVDVDVVQGDRTMVTNSVVLGRLDSGDTHFSTRTGLHELPPEPSADGLRVGDTPMADIMHLSAALDVVLDRESFAALRGEKADPVFLGWARPKDAEPDLDFTTLICDISPPVVMNLGLFGWAPTVQLSTYLRRHPAPGWLRYQSSSTEVGRGMFEEDHLVIDSAGTVVAQSRQLALIPNG
ncbi:thioesterase family protein [Gordonia sp. CPCC 205333]|uniref:thioesterase family protein n=1 Tax=Gordonia sp. CPCC 205333 TaxID=3140790 RepID=UPI003AF363B3